jgi:NADPH2:quinone reductase
MRAIVYSEAGGPEVLRLVERPVPEPGPGEVRVRVAVSGVNPTDWKARSRGPLPFPEVVPDQDGAGAVDAVGEGVPESRVGERVWIWEAAWGRADGTAQEYVVLPARQAVRLPDDASFDLGASLGIPALTAHLCLTAGDRGARSLGPGTLEGSTVLVAGGAGAVGHAAIQLARWSGARVISTVSGEEKGRLALAAGADQVVNYRQDGAAEAIRDLAPDGIDLVVEVSPAVNAALLAAVLGPDGVVAVYATDGGNEVTVQAWPLMQRNVRYRFVLVYTVPSEEKNQAVVDVSSAVADGVLPVGEEAGLPLHRFPLERTGDAHDAVEAGAVGKVLIDVA